jgi:hypothetical protein
MAGRGVPLVTPAVLHERLENPRLTTIIEEKPNADFEPSFWA